MKQFAFALTSVLFLLLVGCKKNGCIEGTLTDTKTGNPVADATIHLRYEYSQQGSLKSNQPTVKSDRFGRFSYVASENNGGSIGIWEISKSGYSQVFESKRDAKGCDDVEVKLTPLDGLFKLSITNQTGSHDTIYAQVFNKCQYQYYRYGGTALTDPYPLTLKLGASMTQTFPTCVGDSSCVKWKFGKKADWFRTDSLLVKTADTTFFKIVY